MSDQSFVTACCCLLAILLVVCADNMIINALDQNHEIDSRFDGRVSALLAKNALQLSQEITSVILQDSDKPTEAISPLSIYTALGILMMGSNKQTFNELKSLLKISNDDYLSQNTWKMHEELSLMIDDLNRDIPHPGRRRHLTPWKVEQTILNPILRNGNESWSEQQISIANDIFYQNGFSIRQDFRNAVESAYKSTLQRLDFINKQELSKRYINSWVDEKTKGKIKNIISQPIPQSTKSIIVSALYFKALWDTNFGFTVP